MHVTRFLAGASLVLGAAAASAAFARLYAVEQLGSLMCGGPKTVVIDGLGTAAVALAVATLLVGAGALIARTDWKAMTFLGTTFAIAAVPIALGSYPCGILTP